jgi:hypothetical protein
MHPLFLSKVPVNEPHKVPQQGPYGESCPLTRPPLFFTYISLIFLTNIALTKEIYPVPQRPKEISIPPCSPKARPLWKQTSISRTLRGVSLVVTSKGALPPGSPHRAPSERDATFLEPSCIFQCPRYTSPLPGSPARPLWSEMPFCLVGITDHP